MSKLSNCITFMNLISSGRKYSIKELSEILEVTPRMIRVYKDELEKSGIYIDTIMGPYGGYVLNQTIRIPSRKFKTKDVNLLDKYINMKDDNYNDLLLLKDKIRGVYYGSKQETEELKDTNLKIYNVFNRAIREKRKIKINYYSYNNGVNERIIHPIELFLFENGWACAAYCELRNDLRHFEFKRINDFELLDEKF